MKQFMHKHHIIPRHAGGSNDSTNLIELTVEEHAEAHKKLYEEFGRWQDKLAWEFLSKRMTKEQACREATSKANKGKRLSKEHVAKISKALIGNSYRTGIPHTKETIEKISGKNHIFYGKKRPEHSKKMKKLGIIPPNMKGQSWSQSRIMCPHCFIQGGSANMKRYHFQNCKVI